MIKLANPKYDSNGVLVIKDDEIELLAYSQLRDYQRGYFKEPHALDVDDFVENCLGIKVGYHILSLDQSKLGATALADGILPILDSNGEVSFREAKKGQVFVDCQACRDIETSIRFTLGHEAGHSQFDTNVDLKRLDISDSISDTYHDIFGQRKGYGRRTPREWMEHHANRYAVYILMPKTFVKKLWKKYHDKFFQGKRITSNSPKRLWKVIHDIAADLCVAQSSIAFRLAELGIISREMLDSLKMNNKREGEQ